MTRYVKQKPLTVLQQLRGLEKLFPAGKGSVVRENLKWISEIRPTPLSRTYTIRLEYKFEHSPSVFVIEPSLKNLAGDREIPHLYSQEEEKLCLYQPKYREWNPSMNISQTIVPWIYEYFYFFEDWLSTGDWKGGGEHPPV